MDKIATIYVEKNVDNSYLIGLRGDSFNIMNVKKEDIDEKKGEGYIIEKDLKEVPETHLERITKKIKEDLGVE